MESSNVLVADGLLKKIKIPNKQNRCIILKSKCYNIGTTIMYYDSNMLFIFNLNLAFANTKTSGQVNEHHLAISTIGRRRPTEQMMENINYRWNEFLSRFVSGQKKKLRTNRLEPVLLFIAPFWMFTGGHRLTLVVIWEHWTVWSWTTNIVIYQYIISYFNLFEVSHQTILPPDGVSVDNRNM